MSPKSHLPSWSDIELRLELGEQHPLQISADPDVVFVVDPLRRELGLIGPTARVMSSPPSRPARGLRVQASGPGRVGVWIEDPTLLELGWTFLVGVAAIVADGADMFDALEDELARWRELVSRLSPGSAPAYFGLLGELLVLRSAIDRGSDLTCWAGGDGGAIDFRFGALECEVKTTIGNRHEHLIHGTEQLQPSPGAELCLISLIVAPSAAGHGSSVQTLVKELISLGIGDRPSWRLRLERRGIDLEDHLAGETYVLRSAPAAVDVGKGFPALTKARIEGIVGAEARRIRDVSYRLDLEGFPASGNSQVKSLLEGIGIA